MGDVVYWAGVGLTALGLTGGAVAYAHVLSRGTEEKMRTEIREHKRDLERALEQERTERVVADTAERDDRRREHDRLESAVESFRTVSNLVTSMAEGIRHLGERFEDQRQTTSEALGEIKHSMRNLDMKFAALPGANTAIRRVRREKGD